MIYLICVYYTIVVVTMLLLVYFIDFFFDLIFFYLQDTAHLLTKHKVVVLANSLFKLYLDLSGIIQ